MSHKIIVAMHLCRLVLGKNSIQSIFLITFFEQSDKYDIMTRSTKTLFSLKYTFHKIWISSPSFSCCFSHIKIALLLSSIAYDVSFSLTLFNTHKSLNHRQSDYIFLPMKTRVIPQKNGVKREGHSLAWYFTFMDVYY